MATYTKTTNFTAKDNLTSGDPAKVIKGSEFDTEFNAIETAVNSKANSNNTVLTGTATVANVDAQSVETDALSINSTAVTATAAEINTLDGITSTTAELNKLDGFTGTVDDLNYAKDLRATGVTSAELDKIDGLTADSTELNILDGATVTTAELNTLDGITASTAELNVTDGLTATTAELNTLDGITATTTELNYTDGVTSNIQTQLDSKASATASPTLTLDGDVSGSATMTNLGDAILTVTVADDSHNHTIANVDGLQTALDGKATTAQGALADSAVQPNDNVSFGTGDFSGNVDVTGTVTADGLELGANDKVQFGTSDATGLYRTNSGSDLTLQHWGNVSVLIDSDNNDSDTRAFVIGANSQDASTAESIAKFSENGDIQFYEDTGTTPSLEWLASSTSLLLTGREISRSSGTYAFEIDNSTHSSNLSAAGAFNVKGYYGDSLTVDGKGDVVFYDDAGNAKLTWDASAESLGIGTTSPTSFLDVRASGTSIPSTISLVGTNSLGSDSCISQIKSLESSAGSGSSELSFHTRAVGGAFATPTERMRIDSSGNVGIGTASPTATLSLNRTYTSGGTYLDLDFNQSNFSNRTTKIRHQIDSSGNGGSLVFATNPNGGDATERLRIDSSGNVGIGTSSPSYKLHLDNVGGGGGIAIQDSNDAGSTGLYFLNNTGTIVSKISGLSDNTGMSFDTNGSERARIDSSGNLLVGTTSGTLAGNCIVNQQNSVKKTEILKQFDVSGSSSNSVTFDLNAEAGISATSLCVGIEITASVYGNSNSGSGVYKAIIGGYANVAGNIETVEMANSITNGSFSFARSANDEYTLTVTNTSGQAKFVNVSFTVMGRA